MPRHVASWIVAASVIAGCGTPPSTPLQAPAARVSAQDTPGWGAKTWVTMTVPASVLADAQSGVVAIASAFQADFAGHPDIRLSYQAVVVASRDGFQTTVRGSLPGFSPNGNPQALDVDLGNVPGGTYRYYLALSANAIEYDAAGNFRQVWKTYGPAYVSDYGRNFVGIAQ
jgi:hypothetical protein